MVYGRLLDATGRLNGAMAFAKSPTAWHELWGAVRKLGFTRVVVGHDDLILFWSHEHPQKDAGNGPTARSDAWVYNVVEFVERKERRGESGENGVWSSGQIEYTRKQIKGAGLAKHPCARSPEYLQPV